MYPTMTRSNRFYSATISNPWGFITVFLPVENRQREINSPGDIPVPEAGHMNININVFKDVTCAI